MASNLLKQHNRNEVRYEPALKVVEWKGGIIRCKHGGGRIAKRPEIMDIGKLHPRALKLKRIGK